MAIAAGGDHSVFLKNDGSLWTMGYNAYGELGDGTTNNSDLPVEIVTGGVVKIAAGYDHTVFIKDDGSLWAAGDDASGQLGDGSTNNVSTPEQILGPYNRLVVQSLGGGNMQFSYVGNAGMTYALDRCFNLEQPDWVQQGQATVANLDGVLVFGNSADTATNNFWRVRLVP